MNPLDHEFNLPLCRLRDCDHASLRADSFEHLVFRVITDAGKWLDVAYQLLAEQFQPDVLDPLERYVGWLELNRVRKHQFPYLLMVAYCRVQGRALLLGVVSGNIMKVEEYAGPNTTEQKNPYIFAIGHQATDPGLRKRGIKGVGTQLWKSAAAEAGAWIESLGGRFCYSVLEAENDSVGFWAKLGHLWPRGVPYWQPPLEFDATGQYLHPEVPEILMMRPMDATLGATIQKKFLQNIIATMYLNWSLDKYRRILSPEAIRKAESYVMGNLFGRICAEMPDKDPVHLVPYVTLERP